MPDFVELAIEEANRKPDMADAWPKAIRDKMPRGIELVRKKQLKAQTLARHLRKALLDAKIPAQSMEHLARYIRGKAKRDAQA